VKIPSWLLQNLSNEDNSTDFLEYALIATVMVLGVLATCVTLTERVGLVFATIASHL